MMPVEAAAGARRGRRRSASASSRAVFDNIPLTALALHQGGYDWGFLAYAVGFGGSMIWFGSSAGVALAEHVPAGALGRRLAARRLACGGRLRGRLLVPACVLGWHVDAPQPHGADGQPAASAPR